MTQCGALGEVHTLVCPLYGLIAISLVCPSAWEAFCYFFSRRLHLVHEADHFLSEGIIHFLLALTPGPGEEICTAFVLSAFNANTHLIHLTLPRGQTRSLRDFTRVEYHHI